MGPPKAIGLCASLIVAQMARYGILATVDNVLITSGSQQALDLIAKLLINRGDRILVESPTYLGALQAFDLMGAEYVTVPVDDDGLQTSNMEQALRSGPKFMYILPNFQNPGGVTLSRKRRDELVLLSDKYGIPIIEDDPYGQLRYEGEHIPPLVVLDRTNLLRDNGYKLGNVIYLSTFSKVLAPGLRLGWIVAPPDVIARLVQLKQSADLHTSTFTQMVAYEVARDGFIDEHVKLIRRTYKRAPRRHVGGVARLLPARGFVDASPGRAVPVGHHAAGRGFVTAAGVGLAPGCGLRAGRAVLPQRRHRLAHAAELLQCRSRSRFAKASGGCRSPWRMNWSIGAWECWFSGE